MVEKELEGRHAKSHAFIVQKQRGKFDKRWVWRYMMRIARADVCEGVIMRKRE